MNQNLWTARFGRLRKLGLIAVMGLPVIAIGALTKEQILAVGVLLMLPAILYVYVLTIWHWKERYRGDHSDLWGALILLEVSGWFKLVYILRHVIADARHKGRYAATMSSPH